MLKLHSDCLHILHKLLVFFLHQHKVNLCLIFSNSECHLPLHPSPKRCIWHTLFLFQKKYNNILPSKILWPTPNPPWTSSNPLTYTKPSLNLIKSSDLHQTLLEPHQILWPTPNPPWTSSNPLTYTKPSLNLIKSSDLHQTLLEPHQILWPTPNPPWTSSNPLTYTKPSLNLIKSSDLHQTLLEPHQILWPTPNPPWTSSNPLTYTKPSLNLIKSSDLHQTLIEPHQILWPTPNPPWTSSNPLTYTKPSLNLIKSSDLHQTLLEPHQILWPTPNPPWTSSNPLTYTKPTLNLIKSTNVSIKVTQAHKQLTCTTHIPLTFQLITKSLFFSQTSSTLRSITTNQPRLILFKKYNKSHHSITYPSYICHHFTQLLLHHNFHTSTPSPFQEHHSLYNLPYIPSILATFHLHLTSCKQHTSTITFISSPFRLRLLTFHVTNCTPKLPSHILSYCNLCLHTPGCRVASSILW